MAFTDAFRSPQEQAQREAALTVMREKFRREQRPVTKTAKRWRAKHTKTGNIPPHGRRSDLTLGQLAHAVRIAATKAKQESSNAAFIEALELAAEYFEEAAKAFPLPKH